jgi:hypothetical protein
MKSRNFSKENLERLVEAVTTEVNRRLEHLKDRHPAPGPNTAKEPKLRRPCSTRVRFDLVPMRVIRLALT